MTTGEIGTASTTPRHLFVCGAARSGTTALTQLLNRHPSIFLGMERYKHVARKEFTPDLFAAERFFDVRSEDTNLKQKVDDEAKAKYAQALWVGDKVPRYYTIYNLLLSRFPGCHIIYILRDIHSVADSWNRRAADPNDRWPSENDYRRAVVEWNTAISKTLEIRKSHKSQVTIVNYDELLSGNNLVMRRMLRKLDLQAPKPMLRYFNLLTKDWASRANRPVAKDEQYDFLEANADMTSYKTLRRLAVSGEQKAAEEQAAV